MKSEKIVKWFVVFIIMIKVMYSVAYYGNLIISNTNNTIANEYSEVVKYWKHVSEFIFIIGMSILLIYYFTPEHKIIQKPIIVDKETRLLFVLYGVILIFTANWSIFFDKDSHFVKLMDKIK
jgi:hypothetical protein